MNNKSLNFLEFKIWDALGMLLTTEVLRKENNPNKTLVTS